MSGEIPDPVALAQDWVRIRSVTPNDNGLQQIIGSRLTSAGFTVQNLAFDGIQNLYARFGDSSPLFCFAGHTDVVPANDPEAWRVSPFSGEIVDRLLYGRGAADMKGAIAAMMTAAFRFREMLTQNRGSIAFLLTGDEEGPAINGTVKVIEWLKKRNETIDYCLVGEPTSLKRIGDTIKNGRRGSLNGRILLKGESGHVAYPHLAENPLHQGIELLRQLREIPFDSGDRHFDPTRLSLTNLQGGTGTDNVTPGSFEIRFNIRFGIASTAASIREKIEKVLSRLELPHTFEWKESAAPFLTEKGKLIDSMIAAVRKVNRISPQLSTSGGTSDARFFAREGIEVAELGLKSELIHKVNESVPVADIQLLSELYFQILTNIFSKV